MNTYILKRELPDGSVPGRLFSNSIPQKPNSYFGHYQKEFRGAVSEVPDYIIINNFEWFEPVKYYPELLSIVQKYLPDMKQGEEFILALSQMINTMYPLGIYNDDNAHTIPPISFVCPEVDVIKTGLMKLIETHFDKIRNHRYINGKVVWFYKSFEDFAKSLNSGK